MNTEFQIKHLQIDDVEYFGHLVRLFNEVFETENVIIPPIDYLKNQLEKQGFLVFVILFDNKVIGGLTAFELASYYSESSEVFIYDVAIKSEFQKQGLGRELISELKKHCKQNNISSFFVPAHEEDKHALDFYRSTGGIPERVVHFNYAVNTNL